MRAALVVAVLAASASAKVYFHEPFDNMDKWVQSKAKSDYGKFVLSSGETFTGDKVINQGLKTSQDAKFYAAATRLPDGITNKGKNLVVSMSVKHEQGLDCGGGYIKIGAGLPELEQFDGDSEYFLMFGPDKCGPTKKVHVIFGSFKSKGNNLLWKKQVEFPDDKLTHVYTIVVTPENTYNVYIDQEEKESGSLEADWEFLKPKEIDDPADKKPADWVDEDMIDDAEDTKPADWDEEPEKIADPEATQPEDWDAEDDGEWEAPMVPNPKYKGEWSPRRIPNPAYKGAWVPKRISNPEYEADNELYLARQPLQYVGIDIWQVKSGSIFDNIVIGDDLTEVNAIIEKTWQATKGAEAEAYQAEVKKAGEAATAAASESAANEEGMGDDDSSEEDAGGDL